MTDEVKLPRISQKKIGYIQDLVNDTHSEELLEVLGEQNYSMLLELPLSFTEQVRVLTLMDMLLHTQKESKVKFDNYGNRVGQHRSLNDTINLHLSSYVYALIEEASKEFPFAKAIIEAVMFDLLADVVNNIEDTEEVYRKHYLSNSLEKDLTAYSSMNTKERVWFRNVFMSMNESADPLTQYRIQLSLRDAGTSLEELAQQV